MRSGQASGWSTHLAADAPWDACDMAAHRAPPQPMPWITSRMGRQSRADVCHLKREQGSVAEAAEDPIRGVLMDRFEEVPDVHLNEPLGTDMTLQVRLCAMTSSRPLSAQSLSVEKHMLS